MRKFLIAPILSVVMVATVVFGASFFLKPDQPEIQPTAQVAALAKCTGTLAGLPIGQLCLEQSGKNVLLKLDDSTILSLPLQNIQLPPVTVNVPQTIRVTLPRVTVTRPPVTVTLPRVTLPNVTIPGPVVTLPRQAVTVELPGATTTDRLPRQTTTLPGQTVTQAPTVVPVTVTAPNGQRIQTSVTITPSPVPGTVTTKPVVKEKEVRVSVPTAIGIGVGVLLLGLILGLLAIYTAYAVGYKDSEDAERTKWQRFREDLFGKKDEGEN